MRWPLPFVIAVVASVASPPLAIAGTWHSPVQGPVLRLFSVGPDRFAPGQHRGVDLGAPRGAQVGAACGGRVSFAGRVPRGGRTVSVRCGHLIATYQQLGAVTVRRGQAIAAGDRIGTVGSARPRPHIHLGARRAATGAYVDPLALLAGAPRATPPPLPSARRPLPPGASRPRRPVPVTPTPARTRAPARRPLPAGPTPARRPLIAAPAPSGAQTAPSTPPAGVERLPWAVWLGLALFGLGLPLGGLVRVRTRRRLAPASLPQTAS